MATAKTTRGVHAALSLTCPLCTGIRSYNSLAKYICIFVLEQRVNKLIKQLHENKFINEKMALPNSQLAKNPDFLYPYKNPQTNSGRKTYHFGLLRPYRETIKLCGQTNSADCATTEIIP